MSDAANSYQYRLLLINRLAKLPSTQLDQIIFVLQTPVELMPPATAKAGDRAYALLQWAESEVGCGIETVEQALMEVLAGGHSLSTMAAISEAERNISIRGSVAGSNIISGGGNTIYIGLPDAHPAATRTDRNEKILIDAVWSEVEDRLRQSLHNAILVRLNMVEQRHQVSRPWDSQLRTADQKPQKLSPNTHIAEVFDRRDVGRKLLILGHPGSGKTTTLLDLAAALIQQAKDDPKQPIPVMVNLSSWQNAKQSLTDWLTHELRLKYGVSPKLSQTWLAQKTLLPLLDGLDELSPVRQEPVVQAINNWLQSGDGPTGIVVCSRLEEYQLYDTTLALNAAVCLAPLTNGQLQQYLAQVSCQQIWNVLHHDEQLLELLRTPLLLSVAVLANEGIDLEQWQRKQTTAERTEYLLDIYAERRLHAVIARKEYSQHHSPSPKQTRWWLVWLARTLKAASKDEFLIEQLQPSELGNRSQRFVYSIIYSLTFAMTGGLILGLCFGLMENMLLGLAFGFGSSLVIGIVFAVFYSFVAQPDPIQLTESFDFSISRITQKDFFLKLVVSLGYGLIYALIFGLSYASLVGLQVGLIVGLIFGLTFGLIYGLVVGLRADVADHIRPNQGIHFTMRNAVILLALSLLLIPFLKMSVAHLMQNLLSDSDINFAVALASFSAIWGGFGIGVIVFSQHFALRTTLYCFGCIPWNYARFLDYCAELLLLQRIGGRYRFIHRSLRDHFAAMPLRK